MSYEAIDPIDLRLNLLLTPPTEEVSVNYTAIGYGSADTSTDRLNNGWRAEIGVVGTIHRYSENWSVLAGGMFFYGSQSASTYEPDTRDIPGMTGPMTMTVLGVNLLLALDLRLNPYINLEFGPFVGLGGSTISDTGVGVDGPDSRVTEKGHGDYEEIGISLALYARNKSRSTIFGLGLRYFTAYTEADLSFNLEDSNGNVTYGGLRERVEIRQHGFAPQITLGMSF
jgi:hypothetical protein